MGSSHAMLSISTADASASLRRHVSTFLVLLFILFAPKLNAQRAKASEYEL